MLSRRALMQAAGAALVAPPVRAGGARRVVILGGDLVEIVFALGAGDRVVGTDDTGRYPPQAAALPKVGYMRRFGPEGVLALAPDLVLANPAAGSDTALDQLRAAGVPVALAPGGEGWASVPPKIAFVGGILGLEPEAARLSAGLEAEMARLADRIGDIPEPPSVLFLISLGRGAPMASGSGTAADAMIALAGARNAVTGFEGYKPLSAEALTGLAPDALLLPDHAAAAVGGGHAALALAGLAGTPAGRAGRVVVMDALKLLGFGPRTPAAVRELAMALHPDQAGRL